MFLIKTLKDFYNTFTIPLLLGYFSGTGFEKFLTNNLIAYGLDPSYIPIWGWIAGIWMFGIPFGFRSVKYLDLKNQEYKRKIGDESFIIYPAVIYYFLVLFLSFSFSPVFTLIHIVAFIYRTITRPFKGYNATS